MPSRLLALTGPAAAAAHGWDGFRDLEWPLLWCAPATADSSPHVIRTRRWSSPEYRDGQCIASADLVLRHLLAPLFGEIKQCDSIAWRDRVELALEHALRVGAVDVGLLSGKGGVGANRDLVWLLARRFGEPSTESYAETRALQFFRWLGYWCWRQLCVCVNGRILQRVDFVIPFRQLRRLARPKLFLPHQGLIVEVDGRSVHEQNFEGDHRRQTNYDRLGYHWVSFTPTQIERSPQMVSAAIEGAFRRAGHTPIDLRPHAMLQK